MRILGCTSLYAYPTRIHTHSHRHTHTYFGAAQDELKAAIEDALGGDQAAEALRMRAEEERRIQEVTARLMAEGWET